MYYVYTCYEFSVVLLIVAKLFCPLRYTFPKAVIEPTYYCASYIFIPKPSGNKDTIDSD